MEKVIGKVVTWKDIQLKITDEPFIEQAGVNVGDIEVWNAPAVDIEGNGWIVYWKIQKEVRKEAAAWDHPLSAEKLKDFK